MTHQWDAEQTIEPNAALQLIQEQFPDLAAEKIRLLGVGWDNSAFIVNEIYIFRFPRREIALPLLEAEWCALPKLAARLPVPIPFPEWKGVPSEKFPWPFTGYRMVPGLSACHANLSEEQRAHLAEPIARFLKDLHAIPPAELAPCHFFGDNRARIDWALITQRIAKTFQQLDEIGLPEQKTELEALVATLQNLRPPSNSTVVHGDFYVRHLLIDEKLHLAGVIDWGDVHLGDPAIDLAIAHSFLPKSAHAAFKKAYGEISDATWDLAQLRAIYSSSLLALFGHHSGDAVLKREGLRALKVIASE